MSFNLGPRLRFDLYKEAMLSLEKSNYPGAWTGGWTLIRGVGKKLLKDDMADDGACAGAVILHYGGQPTVVEQGGWL